MDHTSIAYGKQRRNAKMDEFYLSISWYILWD